MAGYSGTPLLKKLGIKPGMKIVLLGAPAGFEAILGELPEEVRVSKKMVREADFIHIFATSVAELTQEFREAKSHLAQDGMIWISWPKKAAKVTTDLDENRIREIGLALGVVDVKVCAVDETWSGLKFVYRVKDRAAKTGK